MRGHGHILGGGGLHSLHILFRGHGQTADGGGGVVAFNRTGGVVGAFQLRKERLLSGLQLQLGNFAILAGFQLPENLLPYRSIS